MVYAIATRRCILLKLKNVSMTPVASCSTATLRPMDEVKTANARRGTGYRSSFSGIVCTVFGATSFVGVNLVSRLGNHGVQVIVPYRDNYKATYLKQAGDLGQILFVPSWLEDDESIKKAVKYSDVVINLIGNNHDTWNYTLEKVHIDGARKIAKYAREAGVKKFIHMSTMGASPNPREMFVKGGSRFMKSKWYGELAVREEFPDAIIVRPSDIYGYNDSFFNYYGNNARLVWRKLYLWKEGKETVKQPVCVTDVSRGLAELVIRPKEDVSGKIYQFVGPKKYVLYDLCMYMYDWMWKDEEWGFEIEDSRFSLSFFLYTFGRNNSFLVKPEYEMTQERLEREHTSDIVDPNLCTLRDLGVELEHIEDNMRHMTWHLRAYETYSEEIFEFVPPPPPPVVRDA